jgi:hypothetical protein
MFRLTPPAKRHESHGPPASGGAPGDIRRNGRTVLLLASNGRLGYRVLRCVAAVETVGRVIVLGSRGESSWTTSGLKASRYCAEFVVIERPYRDPKALAQVNAVVGRFHEPIIAPADLVTTRFVAEFASTLAAPCVPTPSLLALDLLARKDDFAAFCDAAGLPHPPTAVAADLQEARRLVAQRPPGRRLVLKPVLGQGGRGQRVITTGRADWRGIDYRPIIVQDYVAGSDVSASAFCDEGELVAFQAYRHVTRPVLGRPLHTGLEFFDLPALRDLAARAAARIGLNGMVNFDARLSEDGQLTLIECNPRPWFTMQFAMLAGRNFARLWFDEALRRRGLPPVTASVATFPGGLLCGAGRRPGAHLRHMWQDLRYFLAVDARGRLAAGFRLRKACLD